MELRNPSNREAPKEPPNPKNVSFHSVSEDIGSNCSTPYVSAPSSPGRTFPSAAGPGYFFSAPASPVHYVLSAPYAAYGGAGGIATSASPERLRHSGGSFEFGGASPAGPMISADEIFLNGQIRPMKLSSHLQRPQALAPLLDLENEVEEEEVRGTRLRSRSIHRRARSMSPMRNRHQWQEEEEEAAVAGGGESKADLDLDPKQEDPVAPSPTSRSSSSGKSSSKRWVFLKDLLYRSKSEGRGRDQKEKEKEKEREKNIPLPLPKKKNANGAVPPSSVSRRRRGGAVPSAHERHYTANRAQAEEMRRRTFLPYRQGLLGCLGFSSRGYGAVNGIARTLNPISS
ncbi:Uncharacterized protein M6B38_225500 [Iris pallida]|uniref:Uncharacterized protein n=1 Tax=Iris pallida TaxID=29817 RepID=A0AAX6DUV6_IRIPA|nr:Uncharacterized protein M6B38_225500 [Iris pallida]